MKFSLNPIPVIMFEQNTMSYIDSVVATSSAFIVDVDFSV